MADHTEALRLRLASGPFSGSQLGRDIGLSQPTVSRALAAMSEEVIKIGQRKTTRYALRDRGRGFDDIPVYRVDSQGQVKALGVLTPVRPDGFVFTQTDGRQTHSHGLPWWLLDMRPQGYLGRTYAARYGAALGLPSHTQEWTDSHALRALLMHGHDAVGNLLLGALTRDKFMEMPNPERVSLADKGPCYANLAISASRGESPGSSAGGEQPKFTACVETADGPTHVIVKFSEVQESPISERWRDLLLAEHLALTTLRAAGLPAAKSAILDHAGQRFLEVERFDRIGTLGRRAVISLAAFDAEYVGAAHQTWPVLTKSLLNQGVISPQSGSLTELLWAYGVLIGNTDMHSGNLSFVSEHGRPYALAPAYDMTPMAFAPSSSGRLQDHIPPFQLHSGVSHDNWRNALALAQVFLASVQASTQFSLNFQTCIAALATHLETATARIARLD